MHTCQYTSIPAHLQSAKPQHPCTEFRDGNFVRSQAECATSGPAVARATPHTPDGPPYYTSLLCSSNTTPSRFIPDPPSEHKDRAKVRLTQREALLTWTGRIEVGQISHLRTSESKFDPVPTIGASLRASANGSPRARRVQIGPLVGEFRPPWPRCSRAIPGTAL